MRQLKHPMACTGSGWRMRGIIVEEWPEDKTRKGRRNPDENSKIQEKFVGPDWSIKLCNRSSNSRSSSSRRKPGENTIFINFVPMSVEEQPLIGVHSSLRWIRESARFTLNKLPRPLKITWPILDAKSRWICNLYRLCTIIVLQQLLRWV